jgi:hypothetical protein
MGEVFQLRRNLIANYPEETVGWPQALISPGKTDTTKKLAPLSQKEAEMILLKLDNLAMSRNHDGIANMVAEEAESILFAIRLCKDETKANFAGILGVGSELDIRWLRVQDIGATFGMNAAATGSLGPYLGTSGAVFTWLSSFVAGTAAQIVPVQTSSEECAVIHLGIIDTLENGIPKCNGIEFQISGIAAPAQCIDMGIRRSVGDSDLPFARFEKPIIIGPETSCRIRLMPNITGDSKPQLLSLLIARAQDLTL